MNISPLQNPNNQNPANLPNNPAAVALNEAIHTLEEMFDEYFELADGFPNGGHPADCEEDDCCLLEFFYYYDPALVNIPAYKNAIWIRINNDDTRWLFVLVNEARNKKARIISENDLGCPNFLQEPREYHLPPNFNGPFTYFEPPQVRNITYIELMQEIIDRLPCVC